jgi:HEAT repeat protein
LVLDAYESDDQAWQSSALFSMAQSQDSCWLPTAIDELANPDAQLRYEAARACGAIGDEAAVPELLERADDEDAEVRQAVIALSGRSVDAWPYEPCSPCPRTPTRRTTRRSRRRSRRPRQRPMRSGVAPDGDAQGRRSLIVAAG